MSNLGNRHFEVTICDLKSIAQTQQSCFPSPKNLYFLCSLFNPPNCGEEPPPLADSCLTVVRSAVRLQLSWSYLRLIMRLPAAEVRDFVSLCFPKDVCGLKFYICGWLTAKVF